MNNYTANIDPDNIRKKDMEQLADHIENYINLLEEVMIIPDEIKEAHGKRIEKSIKIIRKKLIKKLRKGDKSVFKDPEDWNLLD